MTGSLLTVCLLARPALAEGTNSILGRVDAGVVSVRWVPDLAVTGLSLGGLALLYGQGPRSPGGVAEMRGLDLPATPRWNPRADAISDAFSHPGAWYGANLPVLGALGVGVYGGLREQSLGAGAAWSLVAVESVSVDLFITEILKVAISRPRPYTAPAFQQTWPEAYASETLQHDLSEAGHYDAYKSFPSGHTSSAGAISFSVATLLWQDLRARGAAPWVAGLAYGGATALTASAGTLRVAAGYHHPTDVIAGGLLGAGVGIGTARLHTLGQDEAPLAVSVGLGAVGRGEERAPALRVEGAW